MGKDHDKQADVDDKKKKGADVDVDAEHNKDVSRKASNAGLKREAHSKAEARSAGASQDGLKYMSAEFYNWMVELREIMASDASTDAGAEPQIQQIEAIYRRALGDAMNLDGLLSTMNKDDRHVMYPEVKAVMGNAYAFLPLMHRAATWIKEKPGHEQDPLLDTAAIRSLVDGLPAKMGMQPVASNELRTTKPESDEQTMRAELAVDEIDSLEAAIVSVESGNAEDASRVTLHARFLDNFAKEHGVRITSKAKHGKLVELKKKLDAIRAARGANDMSLNEASNHLTGLINRHN